MKKSQPVAVVYDHEKDIQLSIQLNQWILKPIGAWPRSVKSSWIKRCVHVLVNMFYTCLLSSVFIPCAFYIVLEVEDTYDKLRFIGPLGFCMIVIVKYYSLILRENDIRRCIDHMKNDWMNTRHYGDRAIMIRNAEFGRRLITISAFFTYGGTVFYHIAMPISMGKITEEDGNLTYRQLAYPVARVIVDTRQSPVGEIFFCIQCMAGFFTQTVTVSASSLAAVFAMHAYGRLEILMQWIMHLVDGREDLYNNVDKRLTMIVQQHVRILRFISLTEKVLHEISLVEMIGCTANICFLGYYAIMEWKTEVFTNYVTYIILLMAFTFNIFILCYIGELVAQQCRKVSEISYMIDWYRLPRKKALPIVLLIAMSNSSIKLTAGNLIELSLSSFSDVIKTSVAYLNMLRTFTP